MSLIPVTKVHLIAKDEDGALLCLRIAFPAKAFSDKIPVIELVSLEWRAYGPKVK